MGTYIIETERLGLRPVTQADFAAWHAILSDAETMRHYPAPFSPEKTQRWIDWNLDNYARFGCGLWAVICKDTGEFIGDCGLTMQDIYKDGKLYPEMGFHIARPHWRRGYASEAARAVLRFAFDQLGFDEVFCYQQWTNEASRRTAEKLGMRMRAEYPDAVNGKTSVYSITRSEYRGKCDFG